MNAKTFYTATKLANWERHNQLRDRLVEAGHAITHDWTVHSPWARETNNGLGGARAKARIEDIRQAGVMDLQGVRDADVTIVLLPGGNGTHTEMGAALVLGKPIFLVGTNEDIWNTQKGYTNAFYHLDQVHHVDLDEHPWDSVLEALPKTLNMLVPEPPPIHAFGLDAMARIAFDNARRKGFWGDPENPREINVSEKMILIVTEIAEAYEHWREGGDLTTIETDVDGKPGKPGGFPTELADIIIRIGDMAGRTGIPLDEAMARKMAYNLGRPWMHGNKRC